MSVAERADALEVLNDWDDLDTPEATPPAPQPRQQPDRPDPESETQDHRPAFGQADPATPVAEQQDQQPQETPEQVLQRVLAENAELQRKMAAREWSSEGRYRAEAKKNEQLQERLKALESERQGADDFLRQNAEQRIAQFLANGDQQNAQNVRYALEAELAKRELAREREDKALAQRHAQELAQAQAQHEQVQRGRQVQQAFAPALLSDAKDLAGQLGLDEDDTRDLLEFAAPPSLRKLALNTPPEVLGQLAIDQWDAISQRAAALQQRKVARNQASFDTTRERAGGGASRDLAKEFDEADDWEAALAVIDAGYVEPPSRHRGARRR